MLKDIIKVYKKIGETPLESINSLKNTNNELKLLPMTYAGRLDPLAEGLLLILTGERCHDKDSYLNLDKEYEVDILFGYKTDTYDILGKINNQEYTIKKNELLINEFNKKILSFIGKINQKYPAYSSRTVKGKPLFMWARENKLNEIEIPSKVVNIYNIDVLNNIEIKGEDLLFLINNNISKVKGDFRQKEILSLWREELKNKKDEKFLIIKIKVFCSSGVYVRSIANEIGSIMNIPTLALKIKRTKIGNYEI